MLSIPKSRGVVLGIALACASLLGARAATAQGAQTDAEEYPCQYCLWCMIGGVPGHELQNGWMTHLDVIGQAHPCVSGICPGPHSYCPDGLQFGFTTPEKVEAFEVRLAAAALRDLPVLLSSFGESVAYNQERQALQLRGCGGKIVAHIPLQHWQVTQLTTSE